ncbi:Uma2 family endonuclease [Lyngbya sp. CCY1209]|jgi:Uma2 family endonuclease|uniref:Uma2 family endonuclease n=1 Tax=Lyngbya sp. CCY1209 TaxID=2886103 RepID=UPI002D208475|nr:Uma2 family endonuclease [Lyngbya sp. CCY1209]MEB3886960.1 Uma2 family endonuclease [Lyngbya sp. CCY1209]
MIQLKETVIYPDSDGKPMSDNTQQFRWIVVIKENLEIIFNDDPNVFIAGDLLWYPEEGNNKLRQAPDVMVAFGRQKGDRGSYKQWEEEGITPQVVFEILSPGNTLKEMAKKLKFYDHYGVEEYYIFNPDRPDFNGWLRSPDGRLDVIEQPENWTSPRLGIRFELQEGEFTIYRPDGERFLTPTELAKKAETERQRAETERQRAETAEQQMETERQRAETAEQRVRELEARLRELGQSLNGD